MSNLDLLEIINNSYDEIFIYDDNYNIVYVNSASERHYGYRPDEMIGKTFFDFFNENIWDTSVLPTIYKEKKPIAIKQTTHLNVELFTIAVPIFDESDNIKYVIMNVRSDIRDIKLLNPQYIADNLKKDVVKPVYRSDVMSDLLSLIEKIAQTDATCIFSGETGTGKTMLANYMHKVSPRKNKPFFSINCANISDNLFESELFGYEKGAFTGANTDGKKGLFSAADKGTLFLDEVSELSLLSQAKLLDVLQDDKFLPIGSTEYKNIDVRIIVATNRNLEKMVKLGNFREDLYYRLNLIDIYVPPLRERKKDIRPLIKQFSEDAYKKYNIRPNFSEDTMKILINNTWKGNIRELKYTIERLTLIVDKDIITPKDLPNDFFGIQHTDSHIPTLNSGSLDEQLEFFTSSIIKKAYKTHNTSRSLAKHLEISQTRANNLIRKYIKETK